MKNDPQQQIVHNLIILDESGSMETIKRPTINGFNELVQTIRSVEQKFPGQKHFVSLFTFNSEGIKKKFFAEDVNTLRELADSMFQPDAMTPLYDAVGRSVNELRRHIKTEKKSHALVTIFTDGEENHSVEYDQQAIRSLVDRLSNRGWTFTYIGTSENVEQDAADIGVSESLNCLGSPAGIDNAFEKDRRARTSYAKRLHEGEDLKGDYFEDAGED